MIRPSDLSALFAPRSIAVFGASERAGSVGCVVFENLLKGGFGGTLYPINPSHPTIQGQRAYATLEEVGAVVDLAVIATPAATVLEIIEHCGQHGVPAAVVLSAGFGEMGEAGRALERQVRETARRSGLRLIGPNCLGIMRPSIGLNATFNKGSADPGRLALVSQSGALCTAILDWARVNDVGFSSVVSMGSSIDVDFGDVLDFLTRDPETDSILLYVEGIRHARNFMSALRAAARVKPVVAIKVGHHPAASRAARSHTGAMVGADDVFDAALRRAGVVRVQNVEQLFAVAKALASGCRASGHRLAIVTNGGGPGVMAVDRACDLGVPMAALSERTMAALNEILPVTWSHANPVDIIGDATPERYRRAIDCCLADDGVDAVLAILTPQAMTEPTAVAQALVELGRGQAKPILACWMGEVQVAEAHRLFAEAHMPAYATPEAAVETFSFVTEYYLNQQLLGQAPEPLLHPREPDIGGARMVIEAALAEQRSVLTEMESKALLAAFHIPVAQTMIARSPNEALQLAEQIGFPVAMKINSPDITHKSDVGGVRLGLANAEAVRAAFHDLMDGVAASCPEARLDGVSVEPMLQKRNGRELMVGVVADPQFGPVVTFGAGGVMVEVLQDRSVALPPLNAFLVRDMIAGTRIARLLQAFRQMPPVKMQALEAVLLRVSEMVCELPWLREMDINPLIVDEDGAWAVDARVMVGPVPPGARRYAHMAIHPYPTHLVSRWQLEDGTEITLRPIRPEDMRIEQTFFHALSEESRYLRFLDLSKELSSSALARFTQIDYDREMALIATAELPVAGQEASEVQLGVARYIIRPDGKSCEFALVVADAWQQRGIARKLLTALIQTARDQGLSMMEGDVLVTNAAMMQLAKAMEFEVREIPGDLALRRITKVL